VIFSAFAAAYQPARDPVPVRERALPGPVRELPVTPKLPPRDGSPSQVPAADGIILPTDTSLRNKLDAARDYIKAGDWDQSVRLLQTVLDAGEDSFFRQTYTDGSGQPAERWASTRAEAERLVATLPDDGRKAYEVSYNGIARKLLGDGRAANDLAILDDVARRYQHTSAGAETLTLLGSLHLDRGRFDLGAVYFQRLLRDNTLDKAQPLTLFQAALAFGAAGDADRAERTWDALSRRLGTAPLKLGEKEYPVDQLRRRVVLPKTDPDRTTDWPLFRGTAARTGRGEGDVPLLDSRARLAAGGAASLDWLRAARPADKESLLPVGVPVASGNRIVFRGVGGVRAVDTTTGREVWRAPGLSLEGVLHDSGKKVQIEDWFGKYRALGAQPALTQNFALGTLSCDGRNVYVVEDLPLPPPPQMIFEMQSGVPRHFGPLRDLIHHNRLRAVDLATGAVAWETGGRPGMVPAELADSYFLGPPLPVGGSLYVLVEKQSDLRLLCLNPDKGTLRWAQTLATARTKLLLDVPRRLHAVHLAFRDGVLVCPTNAGAVLGFDVLSRTLLWAHPYREKPLPMPPPGEEMPPGQIPPESFALGLKHTAPIVVGDRVVYGPPDGESIRCFSLRDGSLIWKAAHNEDDLYVGGVQDGRVWVVGRSVCRTLSLDKGEVIWQQPIPEPSGLGAFCGTKYYLPLRDTGVLVLDPEKPSTHARLDCRKGEAKGNLVFFAGDLWSQDDRGVTAYPQLAAKLERVNDVLKRSPDDVSARFERGRLLLDKGDAALAVGDFKAVLAGTRDAEKTESAKTLLHTALTRLLQHDFVAAEKYLDEYRGLCKVTIPANADVTQRQRLLAEERRRQAGYLVVLARGREKQGRLTDSLRAYHDLYDSTVGGELLTLPEDPAVQVRHDLWVGTHIAEMVARATPDQRATVRAEIEREAKALPADDLAAQRRFAALYGSVPGPEGAAGREVRRRLATRLAEADDPRQTLAALLELQRLERETTGREAALALEARARVLTSRGLVEDAAACYRTLARDFSDMALADGRTAAAVFARLGSDKRFLPHLQTVVPAWQGRAFSHAATKGGFPSRRFLLADGFNWLEPSPGPEWNAVSRTSEVPASFQDLRFHLDLSTGRLRLVRRITDAEVASVALPRWNSNDGGALNSINGVRLANSYWPLGHLVVVGAGPVVFGFDPVQRRVCWERRLATEVDGTVTADSSPLGGIVVARPDGHESYLGMIGPPDFDGVYLQTTEGLTVLDPATGAVRWQRSDLRLNCATFRDGKHLFLAEFYRSGNLKGVRAVRTADGVSVPVPDGATEAYAHKVRTVGRCILAAAHGEGVPVRLRLYDMLTGKDVWQREFPEKSVVADSVDPNLLAVVSPKGDAIVIDLAARRELVKMRLHPGALERIKSATLLHDRSSFYLALVRQSEMNPEQESATTLFQGDLSSVPVNGRLYAFARDTGKVRWYHDMVGQTILLDQFDDLPIVLCASTVDKQPTPEKAQTVQRIRSIDKITGKTIFNTPDDAPKLTEPFHTLRVDPWTKVIDLVSEDFRLRHAPK
jgi:outer membrane protein assembly factor BamB/tetratricopeptide (TPR) repeat protein